MALFLGFQRDIFYTHTEILKHISKALQHQEKRASVSLATKFEEDISLWFLFNQEEPFPKMVNLMMNSDYSYINTFRIHFCHHINAGSQFSNVDESLYGQSLAFLQETFTETTREVFISCLANGCSLIIYGRNNEGKIVILSLLNFVFSKEGAYINWLASIDGGMLYNKRFWSNGDDGTFRKRGFGTLLIRTLRLYADYLKFHNHIEASNIYLKCLDGAKNFYKKTTSLRLIQFPIPWLNFLTNHKLSTLQI